MIGSFLQEPASAGGAAGRWTVAQIHDTVAKIAAQPRYSSSRQSLLGRFFRYLWDRLNDFIDLFRGSLDARIALIAVGVLVAAVIIARVVVARRQEEARRRGRGIRRTFGERVDYWALAADDAANQRYTDACHALYAAVVDGLVRQGLVSFHASKTSGDYARELRRARAPMATDFHAFGREFDRIVFGVSPSTATSDDYARLRAHAERAARIRAAA